MKLLVQRSVLLFLSLFGILYQAGTSKLVLLHGHFLKITLTFTQNDC